MEKTIILSTIVIVVAVLVIFGRDRIAQASPRIAGKAIARKNNPISLQEFGDIVYTWFDKGTVTAGTWNGFDKQRKPYKYKLPYKKSPRDIVGMAIASNDHVYLWFKDGMVCAGTTDDLDKCIYLRQNREVVEVLLANGADVNAMSKPNRTAIGEASMMGH